MHHISRVDLSDGSHFGHQVVPGVLLWFKGMPDFGTICTLIAVAGM